MFIEGSACICITILLNRAFLRNQEVIVYRTTSRNRHRCLLLPTRVFITVTLLKTRVQTAKCTKGSVRYYIVLEITSFALMTFVHELIVTFETRNQCVSKKGVRKKQGFFFFLSNATTTTTSTSTYCTSL